MLGNIFLNSCKDRRKDVKTEFFVRCRRTYVLKKLWGSKNPEYGMFQKSHLIKKDTFFSSSSISLQENSYSCLVLKF